MSTAIGGLDEAPKAPAPWGSPPTPLLPRWLLHKARLHQLPQPLLEALDLPPAGGPIRTVEDLDRFWEQHSTPIGTEARQMLVSLVDEIGYPPPAQVVLAGGTSLTDLLALPLQPQTRNCLLRAFGYGRLKEGQQVTIGQLQGLTDFGVTVLVDLMCLTEAALPSSPLSTTQFVPSDTPPGESAPPGRPPLSVPPTVVQAQPSPPPPSAWGSPPTPLLPRWYRKSMADTPLPWALVPRAARRTDATPRLRTVSDLTGFWHHRATSLDNKLLRQLADLVQNRRPPIHYVVLPAGIPRSRLFQCPFRVRTLGCVQRAYNMNQLTEDAPTTVGDLLVLPNFGIASLIDFMCVAEAGLESRFLATLDASSGDAPGDEPTVSSPRDSVPGLGGHSPRGRALGRIFAAAQEFRGAQTLGDALKGDLSSLAKALGVAGELDETPISDMVGGPSVAEQLVLAIAGLRCSVQQSPVKQQVLESRIFADDRTTLERVAQTVGLSRERIRQLEQEIKATMKSQVGPMIHTISALLAERLAPVTPQEALEEQIRAVLSTAAVPDAPDEDLAVARRLVRDALAYSCVDGICLSSEAVKVVEGLRKAARELADDAGLVDEARLRAALPDESWQQHWDRLIDRSDLHRLGVNLALRDTAKAKAKAALLKIGKPATKEEIGELSGLAPDRIGAQMSLLPSIVRADKLRWGLAEWVDDEYEGIPAEIIQRINEDGGATRLERLLEELPRRFGVSESSVRAYCDAAMFVPENGRIRLRREHERYHYSNSDVQNAPGVFALGDGVVGLLYEVDREVTRGSGRQLSPAAGALLDLSVNERLRFDGPRGTSVTLTFPGTSFTGPSLGSTRGLAEAVNAKIGDMLTVILRRGEMTASAQATDLNEYDAGWTLVARLTGISENAGMDGLAAALRCSRGEVRASLRARRDTAVLEALPARHSTLDLEEALAALDAEMLRDEPS